MRPFAKSLSYRMIYRQHKRADAVNVILGDSVMKRVPERQSKVSAKLLGPYLAVDKVHGI